MSRAAALRTVVLIYLVIGEALAQGARLGESCDLRALGATETGTFLAFDREFKFALSKQDAGLIALLVASPLRINDSRGSYYLDDARSLQLRYSEIFPPAVADIVLKQRPDTLFCNEGGVMYGNGVVWINRNGQRYAIEVINLPETGKGAEVTPRLEFACNTKLRRLVIDKLAGGTLRYRAWNRSRALTEKPDVEVSDGREEREGSGSCAYTVWTFTQGNLTWVVEGAGGCTEDARGVLRESGPGKTESELHCN